MLKALIIHNQTKNRLIFLNFEHFVLTMLGWGSLPQKKLTYKINITHIKFSTKKF
jgi:hypothetical protein